MKKIIAMLLTVVIAVSVVFSAVVTTNAAGKKAQKITGVNSSYTKELKAKNFTLKAKAQGKLSFKSSDKYVATVTKKGVVDVKHVGTATITIKAKATAKYKEAVKKVKIYVGNVTCKAKVNVIPSYDFGDVCALFKNYYNYPVSISATCVFYDANGSMVDTSTGSIYCLGYSETNVINFNSPSDSSDYMTPGYSKYKITYTVKPTGSSYANYTSYNKKIKVLSTGESEDRLSVEVKNTSGKTLQYSPYFAVVFYDEKDQVIGYRFTSVQPEIKEPGTIGYFSTYYPYDSVTHQYVKPARVEIYPTSAYTIKYK